MENIDDLELATLSAEHAPLALQLSTEARWNQTEADWLLMIGLGDAFGYWTSGGRLVASALALPFGASPLEGKFGWISMVIVTGEYRQRGIATRLLNHCAETLRAKGLVPGLDATEAGREVYRPLGFREVYGLSRMFRGADQGREDSAEAPVLPEGLQVRPIEQEDFEALCRWDRPVFGADRSAILRHLQTRLPGQALLAEREGRIVGFVMARDGREAVYIGPLVAEETETAVSLAQSALAGVTGAVYLDVADRHGPLLSMLAERGFSRQRTYSRMLHHHDRPFDDPEKVYAIAGPELG